ncbi:MAG: ATP-binding protein, partial [Micrococcales bacterium]|nr:ATP-binding protein [Micrococcales bacterium]
MAKELVERWAKQQVIEAMGDTRVVFVMGARQVGKSTLVTECALEMALPPIVTLDNKASRDAALADPTGFLAGLPRPAVLDEVQRAPDLLLAVKQAVDQDNAPGQFILTGSSNVRTNRKIKDSLTGRMEIITLWPLAQAEIHRGSNLVDALFAGTPPMVAGAVIGPGAFAAQVAQGGFPEAIRREGQRRDRWLRDYLDSSLDKDLRDVSDALKLEEMPRLIRLAAAQASGLVNYASLASRLGISQVTVKSYVELLETVFLLRRVPAWRPGLAAREVHSPRLHLTDTAMLLHLLGADQSRIGRDDQITGKALENFVVMEMIKQAAASSVDARVYHYRAGLDEVDLVLESRAGDVVGIEVKASATPSLSDRRALEKLRGLAGERFKAGMVVYSGTQTIPLGDRLWAMPISG